MGPPCDKNAGPSVEINWVNKVGYGNWDNSTRDLYNILGQSVIEAVKKRLTCL